jgi:phosphohistidine phosphatase
MKAAPEWILTSPLLRAMQTAKIAADVLGVKKTELVVTENLLPQQDPEIFLASLTKYAGANVLAVGHAPHIDEILARAIGIPDGSVTSLKKAGAALVELGPEAKTPGHVHWVLSAGTLRRVGKNS